MQNATANGSSLFESVPDNVTVDGTSSVVVVFKGQMNG